MLRLSMKAGESIRNYTDIMRGRSRQNVEENYASGAAYKKNLKIDNTNQLNSLEFWRLGGISMVRENRHRLDVARGDQE